MFAVWSVSQCLRAHPASLLCNNKVNAKPGRDSSREKQIASLFIRNKFLLLKPKTKSMQCTQTEKVGEGLQELAILPFCNSSVNQRAGVNDSC